MGAAEWMKAEGQNLDMQEYITVYPIVGYMYGDPVSREVFPIPDLRENPGNNYYICVKNGEKPVRPK
jgi:microcystin-dependent protein